MVEKVSRYYRRLFILAIVGYFLGGTVYVLFGGENNGLRFIAAALGSAILMILGELYQFKKDPKLKGEIKILSDDERNHAIQGRAARFTLIITYITLFIIAFIGIVLRSGAISYGAATVTLFLAAVNRVAQFQWNKRM
ncbi:DUF2178 domain-containing protein [Alkalicella caledoniensis]|uniref:DUF2178 domain-containing protein n=1 Tax=Alkalicella caledoniensis TaxID=2731377 RepID=A0A7G9W6M2_ALKCA|nr:DUF2178 domain-containing protein [Alkalicella caledoniensis]QNO14334.1 DUF2178 domain-containing protein [Alkalicella caledoniensis]